MLFRLGLACGLFATVAIVSCTGSDPSVLARVQVEQGSLSRCVILVATGEDGGRGETVPIGVSEGQALAVAVFQGPLSAQVTLQAEGYAAPDCAAPQPDELSDQRAASFDPGAVRTHDLTLGAEGACNDGVDGDGDDLVDCADPACTAAPGCLDGGTDGGSDAGTSATFPYPPSNFSPSSIATPDAGLVIDCDAGYDTRTQTGWLCGAPLPPTYVLDGGAAGSRVLLAVNSLAITSAGQWRITGAHPLILAVFGSANIDGPLLGGAAGGTSGPGGARQGCPGAGGMGLDGGNGGGGGGGGGYGRKGAPGSPSAGTQAAGGDGGATFGTPELVPLLGGCRGGSGGVESTTGLEGGGGGGAIQLSAAGTVQVSSAIGVPGGGGRGGTTASNNGGGGGGSGGAILLEGSQLVFAPSARVTANGGGGAEGSDSSLSQDGEDGRIDGSLPARGGSGGRVTPGGDGGAGTVDATPGTLYIGSNFGGGGGGGGVGRIRLNASERCVFQGAQGQVLSPPATSNRAGDAGCP